MTTDSDSSKLSNSTKKTPTPEQTVSFWEKSINDFSEKFPRNQQHGLPLFIFKLKKCWEYKTLTPLASYQKGLNWTTAQITSLGPDYAEQKIKLLNQILESGILAVPQWGWHSEKMQADDLRKAHEKTKYGKELLAALARSETDLQAKKAIQVAAPSRLIQIEKQPVESPLLVDASAPITSGPVLTAAKLLKQQIWENQQTQEQQREKQAAPVNPIAEKKPKKFQSGFFKKITSHPRIKKTEKPSHEKPISHNKPK